MNKELQKPDYLFEVSWEICNKIGGIHTVISTKAPYFADKLRDKHILLGPDVFRDETEHPEFEEDTELFKDWKAEAAKQSIGVKIGYWKIPSHPVVILVDFSKLIHQKDEIFSKYWESFRLDSLSGQWDYIEPALFGYAAGRVIESFVNHYLRPSEKVITQFHEWLTGMGILYIKEFLPRAGTIFTSHSTVIGRMLASQNIKLYKELDNIVPADAAKKLNIISKNSLEKLAAVHADVFNVASNMTARECEKLLGKAPDRITPNGFDENTIPNAELFDSKREQAREKIKFVTEKLLGHSISENAMFIATSGRYEFRNKGIDVFLDALGKINTSNELNRELVVLMLLPANHYGPRKELKKKIDTNDDSVIDISFITHNLHYIENDPVITKIKSLGLDNKSGSKVKVVFVPSYLDGKDGIFNVPYYDLLIGFDLTVFPSYYEPWGYTPMESLAFKVPSIASSLSGFGNWIEAKMKTRDEGLYIIHRNDENDKETIENIAKTVIHHSKFDDKAMLIAREKAATISHMIFWQNFIDDYHQLFNQALERVVKRDGYKGLKKARPSETVQQIKHPVVNAPNWKRITVLSNLPEKLGVFNEFIKNLWWTWDCKVLELFEEIDPAIWKNCERNPIALFERVDYGRLKELENDKDYLKRLNNANERFKAYMAKAEKKEPPRVAYFSMEFGLHESLKIYSGGLGILAGDYLKEASDSNIDMVGIGLLYRYGYFKQLLSINGEQIVSYESEDFSKVAVTPVRDDDGNFKTITIVFPGRKLYARIWKAAIGRINLYLLDTDFDANSDQDRYITHNLYGGDQENRLKQEILLGIGGTRALEELGIKADIFHSNEGHSAFCGLERLLLLINKENLTFWEAREVVRSSTLFTTHTPVPAGHDSFSEELLRTYIAHYPSRLKITWDELMAFGRANPNDRAEKFNMSYLAAHLAQETNGVSMLHGTVTRDMFAKLWPGYLADELYIGHVTNGVHYPTWTAHEFRKLYSNNFGENFEENQIDADLWAKIHDVDDQEIWAVKQTLKKRLITYIKDRFRDNWIKRHENPQQIIEVFGNLKEDRLTIGFARRFATYKRAQLLFKNLERLSDIVNNPDRPIQFLFAGKAHPHDKMGQELIRLIVDISKRPEFIGKVLFLQNYDMELARKLVQGVDIWMNTPTRPLEASGTSGQKAAMNGVPNFSVLDGWWVEGFREDSGWSLPKERTYDNQEFQDKLDAETIYSILENEILPVYYDRDKNNIPKRWIGYMKNTIGYVAPKFTTTRMITDYRDRYYHRLYERSQKMRQDDHQMAKEIAFWKNDICKHWEKIEVLDTNILNKNSEHYQMGTEYDARVTLNLGELTPEDIGVEIIMTNDFADIVQKHEFEVMGNEGKKTHYELKLNPLRPGTFNYGLRIFPKNNLLPHRQDFGYLKWI